jgi:cytidylate kinase
MSKSYKLSALRGKVIAIDGPAGSGKSTTAKLLAERLSFIYLDTGAMYRAVTLFALEHNVSGEDARALEAIALKVLIEFKVEDSINKIFLNGVDVTEAIRSPEVTDMVSPVSAHSGVRKALVARQREMARQGNVVAEGRDTTSIVFSDADLKIYLDASLQERARRRLIDFSRQGISSTVEDQAKLLSERDKYDSGRSHSPLTKTKDSILIDTTNLNIEEQVDRIIKLTMTRLKGI